jgi:hypothetical protein
MWRPRNATKGRSRSGDLTWPSQDGSSLIESLGRERHERVFAPGPGTLKTPAYFSAASLINDPRAEGFLPVPEAAKAMGTNEARVLELARRGYLQAETSAGRLYIRPAVVNALFEEEADGAPA